jgi:hypothetical protein
MELINNDIEIDTSVYKEIVEDGVKYGHADALLAQEFLQKYKIPIIPLDISSMLPVFKDPGETSCYFLSKAGNVCISSDRRAFKKFKRMKIQVIQLDTFFFIQTKRKKLSPHKFIEVLEFLEQIYATYPERKLTFLNNLEEEKGK